MSISQAELQIMQQQQQLVEDATNYHNLTDSFVANIRHAILASNENGAFVQHRIAPAVLTDTWVCQARDFMKIIMNYDNSFSLNYCHREDITMELNIVEKKNAFFREGWLNLGIMKDDSQSSCLPLVMFTIKKEEDPQLEECLDSIMKMVHDVATNAFSVHDNDDDESMQRCSVTVRPLQSTQTLLRNLIFKRVGLHPRMKCRSPADAHHVGSSIQYMKDLQASGLDKKKIKAKMRQYQAQRKTIENTQTTKRKFTGDDVEQGLVPTDRLSSEADTFKHGKRNRSTKSLTVNQNTRRCFFCSNNKATMKDDQGSTKWFWWHGLAAVATIYYMYYMMK